MIEKVMMYFEYPFVRYAFVVGILVALCAGLIGVPLVLKRFSFIGDGLSHVAFGAIAIATIMNVSNNMLIVLPVTILAAILLLRTGQSTKIQGDAAMGMLSVGALGLGYFVMSAFSTSTNISGDVCNTLFGSTSILTLDKNKVIFCAIMSIFLILFYVVFYNKLFAITFDEAFAKATGINTGLYNLTLAIVIAVIIVVAMNLVGSLLISALVIFPAVSAMRLFNSFRSVTVSAAIISVVCSAIGIIVSVVNETPVGATIVVCDVIAFLICSLVSKALKS